MWRGDIGRGQFANHSPPRACMRLNRGWRDSGAREASQAWLTMDNAAESYNGYRTVTP